MRELTPFCIVQCLASRTHGHVCAAVDQRHPGFVPVGNQMGEGPLKRFHKNKSKTGEKKKRKRKNQFKCRPL